MIKFTIQSQSEQGKSYQTFFTEKGWHCSCPQFTFREKKVKYCKHITDKQCQFEGLFISYVPEHVRKAFGIEAYQTAL
jgi:hypothetical protein